MFSNDTTRAMDDIGRATIDELGALLGPGGKFSAEDLKQIARIAEANARSAEANAKARIAEANAKARIAEAEANVIMTMTNEQKLQFAQIKYGNNSGIK